MSDIVLVVQSSNGDFRWIRKDTGNNEILSESSESYKSKSYAEKMAKELNPGVEVVVHD